MTTQHLHGGDVYRHPDTIDFSANCNPYGTPESIKHAVAEAMEQVCHYPDIYCQELRKALGKYEQVPEDQIICGNGAADLIFSFMQAVKPERALLPAPTFAEYEQALRAAGCVPERYFLKEENDFVPGEDFLEGITEEMDLVVICNPNNPTGILWEPELLKKILEKCEACGALLMVDECFNDFVEEPEKHSMKQMLSSHPSLFLLKAFTKRYAMAGVRLGYGLSGNPVLLEKMRMVTQPWNVSVLASAAGIAALKETEYVEKTMKVIHKERKYLIDELNEIGFRTYPSSANYVFFQGPEDLWEKCLELGFLIRDCSNYPGLKKGYYRIAVRLHRENHQLIYELKKYLMTEKNNRMKEGCKMAKAIMIQGTMSNAGKSLLTAGLCRIFKQDGYKVAPFKSQNMALNSFVTEDGLEMGRAQVMQAEAAGIKPTVAMNPILLKPTNDMGSQVILNGEVLDSMRAKDYYAYKPKLVPYIMDAYNSLAEEYDIIVIEGAGSPAEINLKKDDIVNMGMAKMAKAPVLLVGDIDRGGVFAQMVGTMVLLEPDEQEMVKGMIINKFRGDPELLYPGIAMLEEKTGKPVVGLAPYMDVQVEDEDSLTERFHGNKEVDLIDLAVIRTPHISNFTDFNVLEMIPGVSLRYVHHVKDLKNPDMILLPGSKNTMEDLLWMRQNGLETAILKRADAGKIVFGICGGYQMLGETISDPIGAEAGGSIKGMGLLPINTVYRGEKTRTRVKGEFLKIGGILESLSGIQIEGYEIHMGASTLKYQAKPFTTITDQVSGVTRQDGVWKENVYGTYVHGIFDQEHVAQALVDAIAKHKNIDLKKENSISFAEFKETQYDLLADGLRKSLDMKKIYEILENGI